MGLNHFPFDSQLFANLQAQVPQQGEQQIKLEAPGVVTIAGMLGLMNAVSCILCLLLARWWQSALFNPGGFRQAYSLVPGFYRDALEFDAQPGFNQVEDVGHDSDVLPLACERLLRQPVRVSRETDRLVCCQPGALGLRKGDGYFSGSGIRWRYIRPIDCQPLLPDTVHRLRCN